MNYADEFFSQAPKYRTKKRLKALFDKQEERVKRKVTPGTKKVTMTNGGQADYVEITRRDEDD